ncbi:hypothetical protein ACQI4F_22870 [Mycolicibacterium vaccae]|uniref:hypothetical protein n=1 Tax=Mycolicibacterium vaccae TaxID=1810 RepID=UPI003CF370A9
MALTWWPVAVVGAALLIAAIILGYLWPTERGARQRYPLAHTIRLTQLPEYRAVVRRQLQATVMVLGLAIPLFGATVWAGARPTEPVADQTGEQRRADLMLCVGQPVTDPSTGAFLGFFARQVSAYGAERIGLTSVNRRVIPMTRDYQLAAGRLGEYAQLSRLQADADAGALTPPGALALRARTASFAPPVEYDDYAPTVADVLALCLTGFPDFERPGDVQRAVIYLGPGELRAPGDDRPSLYSDEQVIDLARRAGARVDAVATPGRPTEALSSVAAATGGEFVRLEPEQLTGQLERVLTDLRESGDTTERRDAPVPALLVAVALAALLGVALMAARR